MKNIFAPSKISINHHKMQDYLNGKQIFPVTMELDLTQLCTRSCPECPYSVARTPGLTLQIPFLDRLFSILGSHTPGIVLSGGEPTIVPHFPETVALARKKGFKEIAIISNGANIDRPEIQAALLQHVTSIRISLYEWQEEDSPYFMNTLKKIEGLRNLVEKEKSKLEIGASILTRKELNNRYEHVSLQALNSGIDWLYFHPYCIDWNTRHPRQADQSGVLESIERLKEIAPHDANIQVPLDRYSSKPLYFEKLHGAHFLLQIGANGINYAGPECKYEKDYELLNLNDYLEDDFLWQPRRLELINKINSDNYRHIGTRHRPPMFSDYVQQLIQLRKGNQTLDLKLASSRGFYYPGIV
ncbi:MAG: radical SAM protein [Dehalococcoidia bacterium]|jgi:organic radical activating enzyme